MQKENNKFNSGNGLAGQNMLADSELGYVNSQKKKLETPLVAQSVESSIWAQMSQQSEQIRSAFPLHQSL